MDQRQDQSNGVPNGEGRRRNNSPTGVYGGQESTETSSYEEVNSESSLGEGTGVQGPVHHVLPEGGDFTAEEIHVGRQYLAMLRALLKGRLEEIARRDIGSEEWYEGVDEITAIYDSIHAVRREFRRN